MRFLRKHWEVLSLLAVLLLVMFCTDVLGPFHSWAKDKIASLTGPKPYTGNLPLGVVPAAPVVPAVIPVTPVVAAALADTTPVVVAPALNS